MNPSSSSDSRPASCAPLTIELPAAPGGRAGGQRGHQQQRIGSGARHAPRAPAAAAALPPCSRHHSDTHFPVGTPTQPAPPHRSSCRSWSAPPARSRSTSGSLEGEVARRQGTFGLLLLMHTAQMHTLSRPWPWRGAAGPAFHCQRRAQRRGVAARCGRPACPAPAACRSSPAQQPTAQGAAHSRAGAPAPLRSQHCSPRWS